MLLNIDRDRNIDFLGKKMSICFFWEPKMCTAGQRVLLTITGPGPSFIVVVVFIAVAVVVVLVVVVVVVVVQPQQGILLIEIV